MHALPGIVDGARKTSQVGTGVEGASDRFPGFSSMPMLEATSSRDQRMNLHLSELKHQSHFCYEAEQLYPVASYS